MVPPREWTLPSLRDQVLRVRYQAEKEKGECRLWGFGGPAGSCVLLPKELGIQANKVDFGRTQVARLPPRSPPLTMYSFRYPAVNRTYVTSFRSAAAPSPQLGLRVGT